MTPTPEQAAIIEAARDTKENLLINALAGAAKTSTLVMIAQALPVGPILSLAFNKRIAEEMKKRLPGHVDCRTLNAIGHRVWAAAVGKTPRRGHSQVIRPTERSRQ
jgi:F-box protein 18 (helicase)